jgi:hypothetical protein
MLDPSVEEVFAVNCYICGRQGWNYNAHRAWTGTQFYCRKGCNPRDIERHVLAKIEKRKKETGTKPVSE